MRYKRYSYRYKAVIKEDELQGPEGWHIEKLNIMLPKSRWRPATDIYETESTITVTADLAGVKAENLEIFLYEDALVIEGCRRLPCPKLEGGYRTAEIRQGAFGLVVLLSDQVDAEQVDAHYEQGLLQITLKKKRGK